MTDKDYSGKNPTELQALVMRLFPSEEYGEDSNVDELWNRVVDLEHSHDELVEALERCTVQLSELIQYQENEIGSFDEVTDEHRMWVQGQAYTKKCLTRAKAALKKAKP